MAPHRVHGLLASGPPLRTSAPYGTLSQTHRSRPPPVAKPCPHIGLHQPRRAILGRLPSTLSFHSLHRSPREPRGEPGSHLGPPRGPSAIHGVHGLLASARVLRK